MFHFALAVALALPYVQAQSQCPKVKRVENFSIDKYAQGVWYEIGRAQNNWEKTGDCVIVTHEPLENGTITFKIATIINNKPNVVNGIIKLDENAKGTGFVDYFSPSYIDSEGVNVVAVDMTAIDYDRYAIVYHCHFDKKIQQLHHYFWILGRTTTLDDATRAEITKIIEDSKMYDMKHLKMDHFSKDDCDIK